MNDIPELNLNDDNASLDKITSSSKIKSIKGKKIAGFGLGIILLILIVIVVIGLTLINPLKQIYTKTQGLNAKGMLVYEDLKKQDIAKASEDLKKVKQELTGLEKDIQVLGWMKVIPILGGYVSDANHFVKAGIYGTEAGEVAMDAVLPYTDLLGLKGQGTFTGGTAEDRIQKTVQTFSKVTPKLDVIGEKIKLMQQEVNQVDVNKYPESFRGKKVKSTLLTLKNGIAGAATGFNEAAPFIKVLPEIMGEPSEKKYLVIFQNDKELRATGGFITAYAVFRLEHGKMNPEESQDIYKLDAQKTKNFPAPELITKYLPAVGGGINRNLQLRDSNLSPDFAISMKQFTEIYNSVSGRRKVDGVIAIDTHVLEKILEIMGPVDVYGYKYSSQIDKRCNCPQVIYELELFADKPANYLKGERKDIIGAMMNAVMKKILSSPPRQYWGQIFQLGIEEIQKKHIFAYFYEDSLQKGAESFNTAGRIKNVDYDYLHVNDVNFAGAKSNMYVKESVDQKIETASDGTITTTLTINYKNPQPADDCSLEKGGLCLNGELRNVLRVYVPKGATLLDSKGSEVKVISYEDLNKTVFEGFLKVRPQGSAQVQIKYSLPFKAQKGKEYKLLIQKQGGKEGEEYNVTYGSKSEKFKLETDREIVFK